MEDLSDGSLWEMSLVGRVGAQAYRSRMPVHVTAGYRWSQPLPAMTGEGRMALSRRMDEEAMDRVKAERYDKQRRVDFATWSRA